MFNARGDLRLAARSLRRTPLFSISVILTLALVIGANTAIFSLVDAMLFRPLHLHAPGQLLRLTAHSSVTGTPSAYPWSYPDFADYRKATVNVFSGISMFAHRGFNFRHSGELRSVPAAIVSASFFDVMGLHPLLGRTLNPTMDSAPNATHIVISKAFWQTEFHSDPAIVGKPVTLNKKPFTIVGVVNGGSVFRALGTPRMFVPVQAASTIQAGNSLTARGAHWIGAVYARLRPEASLAGAQKSLNVESKRLAREYPAKDGKLGLQVKAGRINNFADLLSHHRTTTTHAVEFLWIAVILILAIAGANVLNLFLARGAGRLHEIAIRSVLGASRFRLARQLLTESGLLCVAGGILGVLIGLGALAYAQRFPAIGELHPALDWRILVYATALTVAAALLFGLVPLAAASGRNLARHLGAIRPSPGKHQQRLRRVLSIGQIALAMVLLVSAGLMLHTLIALQSINLGFNPNRLLVAELDFSSITGKPFNPPPEATLDVVRRKLAALPGVSAASFADKTPLDGVSMSTNLTLPGPASPGGVKPTARYATVGVGYFHALGARVLRGTDFTGISPNQSDAVLINQAMARQYWPGQNPVGQSFRTSLATLRVVGVVSNIRGSSPEEPAGPFFYRRYPGESGAFVGMVIRTIHSPSAGLEKTISQTIRNAVPGLPAFKVTPMESRLQGMLTPRTNILWALAVFGFIALLITAVGIFAVMAYNVALRYREFALRMAVGAQPKNIRRLIIRQVMGLAMIGISIGFLLSLLAGNLLKHYLFGISSLDPASIIVVAALLLVVALLAAAGPVLHASRLQPSRVLHDQ